MMRWSALKTCVLALLVLGWVGISFADPIRIGYPTWVGFGPIYLAKEKGFFKTQAVDVDIQVIEDTKLGMAALAANRIDMYGVTPNTLLLYVKPDARFLMVMVGDGSAGGDGIVARKEITSIAALKD